MRYLTITLILMFSTVTMCLADSPLTANETGHCAEMLQVIKSAVESPGITVEFAETLGEYRSDYLNAKDDDAKRVILKDFYTNIMLPQIRANKEIIDAREELYEKESIRLGSEITEIQDWLK